MGEIEQEREPVFLENDFIVLAIPLHTVEVTIRAKVWDGSKVIEVERTMPFDEVRAAFQEANDGYIPQDAVFALNPNIGKSEMERLLSRYLEKERPDKEEGGNES